MVHQEAGKKVLLGSHMARGHSGISSSTCTHSLQIFGRILKTSLFVHLCSPELTLHDMQCMVVFTNKSFVYTQQRGQDKTYEHAHVPILCHFSIKKLNKVITTKDEHCCGAFRRINLEGAREGVVIENLFHFLFCFLRQGLTQ